MQSESGLVLKTDKISCAYLLMNFIWQSAALRGQIPVVMQMTWPCCPPEHVLQCQELSKHYLSTVTDKEHRILLTP